MSKPTYDDICDYADHIATTGDRSDAFIRRTDGHREVWVAVESDTGVLVVYPLTRGGMCYPVAKLHGDERTRIAVKRTAAMHGEAAR